MIRKWSGSRGVLVRRQFVKALRCASLAFCLSLLLTRPALSDVVTLKNGELIRCKVIKEMNDLIKVRMPHRGKIVTTFFNKGAVESISKSADVENRKLFQSGGVHNPGRTYESVYYSGSAPAPSAARGPAGARPMPAKGGKTKTGGAAKKRGIDARRGLSEARAKERGERFGQRTSKGSQGGAAATSPSAPTAPTTSESSGTTVGSFGGGAGVSVGH